MKVIAYYPDNIEEPVVYPHAGSQLEVCAWCGKHRGVDYLELCSLLPQDDELVLTWPGKGDPVAFVSHAQCGPSPGYAIRLSDLSRKGNFWYDHLAKKRWYEEEYENALSYLAIRPLPLLDDVDLQKLPPISNTVHTYFIQSEKGGPVKIGRSRNPLDRLRTLQTGHPERLRIIALLTGDYEARLHGQFLHLRQDGEWFRYTRDITDFLRDCYDPK